MALVIAPKTLLSKIHPYLHGCQFISIHVPKGVVALLLPHTLSKLPQSAAPLSVSLQYPQPSDTCWVVGMQ